MTQLLSADVVKCCTNDLSAHVANSFIQMLNVRMKDCVSQEGKCRRLTDKDRTRVLRKIQEHLLEYKADAITQTQMEEFSSTLTELCPYWPSVLKQVVKLNVLMLSTARAKNLRTISIKYPDRDTFVKDILAQFACITFHNILVYYDYYCTRNDQAISTLLNRTFDKVLHGYTTSARGEFFREEEESGSSDTESESEARPKQNDNPLAASVQASKVPGAADEDRGSSDKSPRVSEASSDASNDIEMVKTISGDPDDEEGPRMGTGGTKDDEDLMSTF